MKIFSINIKVLANVIIKNLDFEKLYFFIILNLFLTSYKPNLKLLLSIDNG